MGIAAIIRALGSFQSDPKPILLAISLSFLYKSGFSTIHFSTVAYFTQWLFDTFAIS